ncbi:hypothetical protein BC939DRAFT_258981 [Gamsiella multidivaricata]|uniref:uncharacterized protein n=1 Tax=Gamsiella multidivaricata TaxID=101098 RepID=UPI00221FF350|nr:uncharacterized protein BC939DRAFT_258981 [Gamsiella multidivaricata]KAI7830704.1 hypothetical protein BC939DRAFT_258981 [Gamsiella multidivaricata]
MCVFALFSPLLPLSHFLTFSLSHLPTFLSSHSPSPNPSGTVSYLSQLFTLFCLSQVRLYSISISTAQRRLIGISARDDEGSEYHSTRPSYSCADRLEQRIGVENIAQGQTISSAGERTRETNSC